MPAQSFPLCPNSVTPTQPTNDTCNAIYTGSTYNTGSLRCDIKPSCGTNYTYNSETGKCKLNTGTQSTTKMEDNISPTCPTKFQLNNLSMCETMNAHNPLPTCPETYRYVSQNNSCCPTLLLLLKNNNFLF
jgi:hypothetical protein